MLSSSVGIPKGDPTLTLPKGGKMKRKMFFSFALLSFFRNFATKIAKEVTE